MIRIGRRIWLILCIHWILSEVFPLTLESFVPSPSMLLEFFPAHRQPSQMK